MTIRRLTPTILLLAMSFAAGVRTSQAQPIDGALGRIEQCEDFFVGSALHQQGTLFNVMNILFGDRDVPDAAWVLVQKNREGTFARFRNATGVVAPSVFVGDYPGGPVRGDNLLESFNVEGDESVVNFEDYPDVHDSHDHNFYIKLDPDPAQADLLSTFGIDSRGYTPKDVGYYAPDTLEVEWETGILTSQLTGDGRFFPKWAWPVPGDRVWVNGYWIFDCGHPKEGRLLPPESCPGGIPCHEKGLKTEIHPPRAIATMRQQVAIPPAGGAPIPVTATDLYIHGRSGVIVDLLECGGRVVVDGRACPTRSGETPRGSDSADGDPSHDIALDHLGTPINEDFRFTICAPPRPAGASNVTVWEERVVPDDTIDIRPVWEVEEGTGACNLGNGSKQVRLTVPLAGTNVSPDSVYARRIYVGWTATPARLRGFRVRIDSLTLNDDTDHNFQIDPTEDDDCECAWFWSSIDRAAREVIRLSDFVNQGIERMNDLGDGETVTFANAAWDFLVPEGLPFALRTFGFDGGVGEDSDSPKQDCLDDHFAHHDFGAHVDLDLTNIPDACVASLSLFDPQDAIDDPFDVVQHVVTPGDILALFGSWPGSGTAQITLRSPLRCDVGYLVGGLDPFRHEKPRCSSAAQLRTYIEQQGFTVISIREFHQYELGVTIEAVAADSDGDGLNDADELSTHHTDPLDADTDDDGLSDGAEVNTYDTDPLDPDSDDDELTDGDEVNTHHTDPLDPDTDDDQLPDGIEVAVGTNPLNPDSDGDGIPDGRDPQFVANAVGALPDAAFRTGGNRQAILEILSAVEKRIASGDIAQAIRELQILRSFIDGCGTAADTTDWIVDCTAQLEIRQLVDLLVTNLGA